jgi:DNA helicase IV
MVWRLLLRRCPGRSFTLVGDVQQATGAAAAVSWGDALTPHVGDAWTQEVLTVNYRTPAQVMDAACAMLTAAGHPTSAPTSVRAGEPPRFVEVSSLEEVVGVVEGERSGLGGGRMAVIVAPGEVAELQALLDAGGGSGDLHDPVVVLTADQAKGLEFDVVVVVDPVEIAEHGRHGARALFVAMTRPTQRLVLAHRGRLPAGLTPPRPS